MQSTAARLTCSILGGLGVLDPVPGQREIELENRGEFVAQLCNCMVDGPVGIGKSDLRIIADGEIEDRKAMF